MGRLKDDAERLGGEIQTLRKARKRFMEELCESTNALRGAVSEMRAGFSRSHAEKARAAQAQRAAFLSHLRDAVAAQRTEFAADLAGTRRVWHAKRA
jgi:hypothetical protein